MTDSSVTMIPQNVEIKDEDGSHMFTTTTFQLLQWRSALKLEKVGMTMSHGRKVSTHLKKLLGLKRNTPIEALQEWVDDIITQTHEAMGIQ